MIKRIDFLGAPGIGKSTIYTQFTKRFGRKLGIVPEFEARTRAARAYSYRLPKKEGLISRFVLFFPKFRNPYVVSLEDKICDKHFRKYVDVNGDLFSTIHNSFCCSEKDNYRRQFGYNSVISKLKIFCSLDSYYAGLVLSDESLSQKVYGINPSDKLDKAFVISYFENIPVPNYLIYFYANASAVVKRIKGRDLKGGKMIPGHTGKSLDELLEMTETALKISEIGSKILEQRGAKVLKLNAQENTEDNLNALAEFLKR